MANKPSKVDKFAHLLGAVTDKQVAKLAGLGEAASVQSQRKKKNIPAFRSNCSKIKKALKTLNDTISDAEAANELDVPLSLFSAMRYHTALKKDKTKTIKKYKLDKEVVKAVLELDTHSKPGRKKGSKTKTTISTVALKNTKKKNAAKKAVKSSKKKKVGKKVAKKVAKKKVAKKSTAVKIQKSQQTKNVVFEQAYECSFVHGNDRTSIYVTAANLLEATKKLEGVENSKAIKGALISITYIGSALA